MAGYTKKDAAKDTGTTVKKVTQAWHYARNQAQRSSHPYDKWLTKGWKRNPGKKK
jgi:hypothetical protein